MKAPFEFPKQQLIIFLGIVLLVSAAFGVGYWYRGMVSEQLQPENIPPGLPLPSPTIEKVYLDHEEIDTYGWVTSHSEGLGLTIQYPKGWYAMDYTAQSGGGGRSPAFGLTFPIKVDLNRYQQITKEGEKLRLRILKTADGEVLTEETIKERLDGEANAIMNYLGYDEVKRKRYEGDDFTALLNYNYIDYGPQRQLDSVYGYLLTDDEAYLIIFSSVEEGKEVDLFYLRLLEKIVSTIRFS